MWSGSALEASAVRRWSPHWLGGASTPECQAQNIIHSAQSHHHRHPRVPLFGRPSVHLRMQSSVGPPALPSYSVSVRPYSYSSCTRWSLYLSTLPSIHPSWISTFVHLSLHPKSVHSRICQFINLFFWAPSSIHPSSCITCQSIPSFHSNYPTSAYQSIYPFIHHPSIFAHLYHWPSIRLSSPI